MIVTTCTEPGGASPNEDWVGTVPSAVVVLDGVTAPAGTGTGCQHGTAWYSAQLGLRLLAHLATTDLPLTDILAAAISETAAAHGSTCDLSHPGTPSAAVAILRASAGTVEYLALADIAILLDDGDQVVVVTDDRVDQVADDAREETRRHPVGSAAHAAAVAQLSRVQRESRNRPGGYWVAAADPAAVDHAVCGSLLGVRRAALLTDGATRAVEWGVTTWRGLLDLLHTDGPGAVISWTRELERDDPTGDLWPRYKESDDATAAYAELVPKVAT